MKLNVLRTLALAVASLSIGIAIGRHEASPSVPQQVVLKSAAPQRDSYQFFDTLVDLRSQILHNYVEPVDDNELLQGAIDGMMGRLDPYSNYFTKDELGRFDQQVHGTFSGIGAEFSQDPDTGRFIIVSPFDDSPALKSGVLAGDRVVKINDETVDGLSFKDLSGKITGPPGTQLKLTVLHEGEKQPIDLSITRAVVQLHSVKGARRSNEGQWDYLLDPEHRIAYVRITTFMENTAEELDKALLPLINDQARGSLKGIILDLRFNPGGLLQAGIDVSNRFLDSGVIVSTGRPDTTHRDFVAQATPEHTYPHIPVVVLINQFSASASEIVAGALKDHHRAVLMGTRSFGKGSVQTLVTVDNGNGALKLTTAYYYLPSGRNIMKRKDATTWGVDPDPAFVIPVNEDENRQILMERNTNDLIRRTTQPATQPVAGSKTDLVKPGANAATQPTPFVDRQLQRASEILIAHQVFGGSRDFTADVTTTRPGASASVPAPQKDDVPQTAPATEKQTPPSPSSNTQPDEADVP